MKQELDPRQAMIALMIALGVCFVAMMGFGAGKLTGALDPLVARRGVGTMLGLMLAATGNFMPKLRFFQPAMRGAHSDSIDRFAGWTFVASGLLFASVFLFAPADMIMIVSPLIVLAGALAVLARWLPAKGSPAAGPASHWTPGRRMLATMLASMLGVSAIFLADVAWGDAASKGLAMLFLVALVSVAAVCAAVRTRATGA